jgi:uncharacterized protein (TIGR02569 family)
VLEAFGLSGPPRLLAGGQGEAFLADGVVLKAADDPEEAAFVQDLAARLDPETVRVARPISTTNGSWVHESWTACEFIPDLTPAAPDWPTVIEVGGSFAAAASAVGDLDTRVLLDRTHRWARADRCAWDEEVVVLPGRAGQLLTALRQLTAVGDRRRQVIHADLAGNVFLDGTGAPVVLDISPYLRPVRWGEAIVVADAVTWWGGAPSLAASFASDPAGLDLLARALIFRLVAEQLGDPGAGSSGLDPYGHLVDQLARR